MCAVTDIDLVTVTMQVGSQLVTERAWSRLRGVEAGARLAALAVAVVRPCQGPGPDGAT